MALSNHSDRAHALLSASSSSRWLACPPSAVAATRYPDTDTPFTREGTRAHEVAEKVVRGRLAGASLDWLTYPWPEGVDAEMIGHAEAYADYIQELIRSEDAVVLLEQRLDFSPWVPGGFGTGDCIIIQGNRIDVIDYKYGQGVAVSAEENSQMKLYGLGALNDFGVIYEIENVCTHIFQPRIGNISTADYPAYALQTWGDSFVKPTAALAAEGKGDLSAGPHCRFCPHAGSCPALADVCMSVYTDRNYGSVPTLAPERVADILGQEPMISAWLKAVKDRALSVMLDGDEVPGYKVVSGRSSRAWADDLEVTGLLEAAGYTPDKYTETKLLSPAGMEKALGKKRVSELLSGQILSTPGAPTVAPASDKRPVYDRLAEARKDFE